MTRRECPLCDEAERVVAQVAWLTASPVRTTDVDSNPELAVDFGLRIPVVRGPDGVVLEEGHVSFATLLRAVGRAKGRWVLRRSTGDA